MRITYRQLQKIMSNFSESQLDSDVTVVNDDGEAHAADLLISMELMGGVDYGLGDNHPFFRTPMNQEEDRATDEHLNNYIQSIRFDGGFGEVRAVGEQEGLSQEQKDYHSER